MRKVIALLCSILLLTAILAGCGGRGNVSDDTNGKITEDFPNTTYLYQAKPVLEKLPGWKCDITGIRTWEELPENCRNYVDEIERRIGVPITYVSNGPSREDIIKREPKL